VAAVLPHDRVRLALPQHATGGGGRVVGTVDRTIFTGSAFNVYVRVSEQLEIRAALTADHVAALGEENLQQHSPVAVEWAPEDVVFVRDSDSAREHAAAA
jgi:hypothetical protein